MTYSQATDKLALGVLKDLKSYIQTSEIPYSSSGPKLTQTNHKSNNSGRFVEKFRFQSLNTSSCMVMCHVKKTATHLYAVSQNNVEALMSVSLSAIMSL